MSICAMQSMAWGISVKNISKAVKNTAWDILNFTQENAKTAFFQSGFIRYIIWAAKDGREDYYEWY